MVIAAPRANNISEICARLLYSESTRVFHRGNGKNSVIFSTTILTSFRAKTNLINNLVVIQKGFFLQ